MTKYFVEHEKNKYRPATEDEEADAQSFQKRRQDLERQKAKLLDQLKGCTHVFWDEEGYLYHQRRCLRCGHQELI